MNHISIALVAPSGTFAEQRLKTALDHATKLGLTIEQTTEVRIGAPEFLNGSSDDRLRELERAEHGTCDAIWCIRGGVGALDLWPRYLHHIYGAGSAPLIGYSDITIYHFMRYLRANRIGIHGPVFFDIMETDPALLQALGFLINGQAERLIYPALNLLNHSFANTITGELMVMNLASLQSVIGCFDADFFRGKILALEDTNEPRYKIFRMMHHLKNARLLAGLKAIVLGYFGHERNEIIEETMLPIANDEGIPLLDWPIFGHAQPNWPLMFGARVTLSRINDQFFTLGYDEQHDHTPIHHDSAQ